MLDLIDLLKKKLNEPLPGLDAQYEMAPLSRPKIDLSQLEPNSYKKSAVMILVYRHRNKYYVPLTKRHDYEGKHSGQVSLPGGKFEEGDNTLQNTALRELNEEIGINCSVEVIGSLTPLYIPVSSFYVEVYIGVCTQHDVNFSPNEREVKELILLDLELLKSDSILKLGRTVSGEGYELKTPYFEVEGEIIWGATAMILNEFKKLLT